MKRIFCIFLALFITYGACDNSILCYAGSKKYGVGYTERGKIKKDKKKPEYRQKKEIDMFVKYLAAKEDKHRSNKTRENFVKVGSKVEKISVEEYLSKK